MKKEATRGRERGKTPKMCVMLKSKEGTGGEKKKQFIQNISIICLNDFRFEFFVVLCAALNGSFEVFHHHST